jgi:xanthine dehydrogenase YagS FAD-binding subunit
MKSFEWVEPRTMEEALQLLGDGAVAKAGGVDLMDRMKEGLDAPPRLVNLRGLSGLDRIEEEPGGGLRIGPLVTLAQLSEHPGVRKRFTALADSAGHAATPQIRNMATVGGNLLQRPRCWYFRQADFVCRKKGGTECLAQGGDNRYHAIFGNGVCAIVHPSSVAPALMVLGASLEVRGPQGTRMLPVEELFIRPDQDVKREHVLAERELITALRLPATTARTAYLKQGEKESYDWPVAEVAVALELDGRKVRKASIVLGAAAPVPWRASAAETALVGRELDAATIQAAAKAALQGANPMSGNAYKLPIFEAVVRRTLLAAGGVA